MTHRLQHDSQWARVKWWELIMDADGLPIVGVGVDFKTVGSIHPKKTLIQFNNFILYTINFLNKFSGVCEEKLENLNTRLQRMEATLCVLETKLASIPGLENVTGDVQVNKTTGNSELPLRGEMTTVTSKQETNEYKNDQEQLAPETVPEIEPNTITVSQDPKYAKYLKMVQVGVPIEALRPKMVAEGLDPDLLQTPYAPLPVNRIQNSMPVDSESDNQNDDSYSDFSD